MAFVALTGVIIALGWFGYIWYFDRASPAEIRAYANGETSVEFHSALGGYDVELPADPKPSNELVEDDWFPATIHFEESKLGRNYKVGVAHADLPASVSAAEAGSILDEGAAEGVLGAEYTTLSTERVQHHGHAALDILAESDGDFYKLRLIIAGKRLFILAVGAEDRSTPGFDRLVESFEIL